MLAALLVALVAVTTPLTASAKQEYLDVRITSVSTPVLDLSDPDQVIELKGTLTNTSTVPISYLVVHFWRDASEIRSTEQLAEANENVPLGARLFNESLGNLDIITREEAFGPGERADFTVRTTVAQLADESPELTRDQAAYLLGVHVRGIPQDGPNQVVGRDQLALAATTDPVTSSAVVALTATPTWLADGSFVDDSLAGELDGRLDTLLTSAERPSVQSAIDPALYAAARRLAEPHTVAGEDRPGNGIALRWVARVDKLASEGRLWRLPFGNPDLARADATGQLQQALAWSRDARGDILDDLDSVVILNPGVSESLVAKLGEFDTVIVRDATGAKPGPPRLLGAAPEDPLAAEPAGIRLAGRIADEFLAARAPLYVIESADDAEIDAELGAWRTHVVPTATPAEPVRWEPGKEPAAWNEVSAALRRAAEDAELLGDLTGGEVASLSPVAAYAFSMGFPTQSAAVSYITQASPAHVDLDKITLKAVSSVVMGDRANQFPATLTNGLTVPVTVGVRFTSDAPQRIRVPDLEPQVIPPGESITVNITPEAAANGVALVQAQPVTAGGVALGKSTTIEITATDFGRVGWIIILVSGAVLLGGTAWRIRAVRRERGKASEKEDIERASQ